MVGESLNFFRPVRVRGETSEAKIESLKKTLSKVIDDSSEDESCYRKSYSSAHKDALDFICKESIDDYYNRMISAHDSKMQLESPGQYDALGRILAEIEFIINFREQ